MYKFLWGKTTKIVCLTKNFSNYFTIVFTVLFGQLYRATVFTILIHDATGT